MVDLAALYIAAIEANRERINAAAARWPDEPIELSLHWHPEMGKVDPILRPSDRLPSYRPERAA